MKNNGINITEWVSALSNQKLFYLAVINKCGQLTFTNSHFFKNLHLTSEALINKKFLDFLHPADQAAFSNALETADRNHTTVPIELRIKNGHYRWVKWEISRFRNGKTPGETFLCLGYDIPCEEQVKKYVSITEQNYQAIVENLNVGIIFQDKDGAVISANQKLAAIFDTTLETIYNNKKLYSLWKTTDEDGNALPFRDAPFMKALATGEPQTNIELNLEISEGQYRSVICNSQPLFEKGHTEPFSVVSTILDITNEKKLEAESKRKGI
ncbi:MAG TPA: PAS domain S-box protein, partial [Puia sp.]|nr:PAS domain S-box protein [Puia sp.]